MKNHKHCLFCNKDIIIKNKFVNNQKFCRKTCRKKYYNFHKYGNPLMTSEEIRRWKLFKERGEKCEICGFVAINKCQLDIDHIDGNAKNNDFSNLQILCANCHRLKTLMNKDYRERSVKFLEEEIKTE